MSATVLLAVAALALPGPRQVYDLSARYDGAALVVTGLAYTIPRFAGSSWVDPRCPCPQDEVPRFDQVALGATSDVAGRLSDWTLALALTAPPVADAILLGWSPAFRSDFVVYFESIAVAGALTQVTKYAVQRPRPRTYAFEPEDVTSTDSYLSFFSGHTALTMAALTAASMTARYRYGEQGWPWAVTALVGLTVAAERIAAGEHFPSDVLAGGVVGVGAGVLVPYLHHREDGEPPRVRIVPAKGGGGLAFRF